MFRRRKMTAPQFGHVPYNAIHGNHANLRQDGTSPFCGMMQIATDDTYEDYVICRGFDPRTLKFIDYAEGDEEKPGISVAKPFGKRVAGEYKIAEVYPALLPTQGNAEFTDFRTIAYTPPSPVDVKWRVGQNPGVASGGEDGGQPGSLSERVDILYDHNGKVVNWLLIDGGTDFLKIYQYVLTTTWSNGVATADIYLSVRETDGTKVADDAPIYDPIRQSLMVDQVAGDVGWCHKQDDGYYAWQAPCDSSSGPGAPSGGSGGGGGSGPPISSNIVTAGTTF